MAEPRWLEPRAGFQYQADTVVVTADYQHEKLSLCGIDPALFGHAVDASFFIGLAIRAGVASGISAEGNVNMLQSLEQHRPARLDESLTVRGEITAVLEVPRGHTIDTDVWFEDAAGERVITAKRRSLKPDSRKTERGAGERPPPVLANPANATVLATHTLTPEIVVNYSEAGNSIHYDLDAAQKAGFRAPLIGGGMGVHYLLAAIYAEKAPGSFALDIYFRRPIFWDDRFSVVREIHEGHESDGMALIRDDGNAVKVLTEMRINALE